MRREPPERRLQAGDRRPAWADEIEAVSLDFGNTLVSFEEGQLERTVRLAAERLAGEGGLAIEATSFAALWADERRRQLLLDVPEGREADMERRAVRVLASLRGCAAPAIGQRWDDAAAEAYCRPGEVARILDAYTTAFVETTPGPPEIGPLLRWLSARYRLALLSNWPLASALERYLEAAGWRDAFDVLIVSQRVGWIKPHRAIFEAAQEALGVTQAGRVLHVGDDLAADVGGARAAGWRAAWVRSRPAGSPLPVAAPVGDERPDLVLDSVLDLPCALEPERRPADL